MTKGQTEQEIIYHMIISLATGCALADSLSVTTVLHVQMNIVLGDSKEVLYMCVCVCGGGGGGGGGCNLVLTAGGWASALSFIPALLMLRLSMLL